MKGLFISLIATAVVCMAFVSSPKIPAVPATVWPTVQDSTFDVAAALASLRESIKGRENEAAETVFQNIQTFKGFPAGRMLAIMERAFNGALGVHCTHCHDPENWASDEKRPKGVTRDMWSMMGTINRDLIANIPNLKGERPGINCTTCHRGEIVPALNLPAGN